MDANDLEMVASGRPRRDTDEVYPGDELYDIDPEFKPAARRQNRCFVYAAVGFVVVLCFFVVVVKVAPMGDAEAKTLDTFSDEQGTVSNNAENAHAKVTAVMNAKKKKPHKKGHAASALASFTADGEATGGDGKTSEAPTEPPASSEEENTAPPKKEHDKKPEIPESSGGNGTTVPPKKEHTKNTKRTDYSAWHDTTVTKNDGVMYEIVEVLEHGIDSFTEGLAYNDGKLYESVGLNDQSAVLVLDPATGKTVETIQMESKFFGEGLTYYDGKLIQLTYKALKGFVYDVDHMNDKPQMFDYKTTTKEGWGLTYDDRKNELIVSDGSAFLHFWDPKTFQQIRKHQIMRLDGSPAVRINELEFWRGRVVANVWFEHVLLIINPETGLVEKEYDFKKIWERAGVKKNHHAEVFNGISISDDPDILYVTGKWWANMFKIKLLPALDSAA